MPSRADRIRREERKALEALGVNREGEKLYANVCLVLKPAFQCFRVPMTELRKETWGNNMLSSVTSGPPIIFLDKYHPAVFAFFALFLNHLPLCPFINLGFTYRGYYSAMRENDFHYTNSMTNIAMSLLTDASNDSQLEHASDARRLVHAYVMGQEMQAPHFQDAIMNVIAKFFHPDGPPTPEFVLWVYSFCPDDKPLGLKRFVVDSYNWAACFDVDPLPRITAYIPAFQRDAIHAATATQIDLLINPRDVSRGTEPQDIIIDFTRLYDVLCNERQGRLKCRYHHHGRNELCFNYIVDDKVPSLHSAGINWGG
ncbi:predicted protein [Plenodomus lingam JN3]|uniref:Uncharacterized protein n=2 Tax=Leptosphaeria maculans TaxID=5022 RepID=E4ZGS2_LEPMJ|nr:predicted protein [Plenodomus lingam JN3]CBX90492.1 predicted protein [Plenodomus lingam JN3]